MTTRLDLMATGRRQEITKLATGHERRQQDRKRQDATGSDRTQQVAKECDRRGNNDVRGSNKMASVTFFKDNHIEFWELQLVFCLQRLKKERTKHMTCGSQNLTDSNKEVIFLWWGK